MIVLACGAAKRKVGLHHAADLYVGAPFVCGLRWALSVEAKENICILSAKHGFITLSQPLVPYEVRFGSPGQISDAALASTAHRLGVDRAPQVWMCGGDKVYLEKCRIAAPHAQRLIEGTYFQTNKWFSRNLGRWPEHSRERA